MSDLEPGSGRIRRATRRRRLLAAVVVVLVAVAVVVVVSRLLAPSDAEIIAKATSAETAWRRAGMVTAYTTIVRQTNPVTGLPEKLRRDHWDSFDGSSRRMTSVRVGTPRTYASIFEPDPLRIGNIAEETSSTVTANPLYRTRTVETPEGLWTVVDTLPAATHAVWWGPCGSCHAPSRDPGVMAQAQSGFAPYLAPINREALRVVGRGKVAGRRTYELRAERPSVPEGYREITHIDVDRSTFLPLRYRIEIVQDLEKAGQDLVDETEIDVRSHEIVPLREVPGSKYAVALPASVAYVARQAFAVGSAVTWPPVGAVPPSVPATPPIYDLGEGYPITGGKMAGVRFSDSTAPGGVSEGGTIGRPDAVVEALHPEANTPPLVRVVTEYGEVTPPGEDPKFGRAGQSLDNGSTYSPVVWIVTVPKVTDATVRAWGAGGSVVPVTAAGRPAFEIRGATIEDSLRPFDYAAVVVQMPDSTVVVTQPPNAPDVPVLVREAASRLVKRQ